MTPEMKTVYNYLQDHSNFVSLVDRLHELISSFESIPDDVLESYEELSEPDMWEILRKLAVEGKKRT